jgi:alanine-synthesizing transaminase
VYNFFNYIESGFILTCPPVVKVSFDAGFTVTNELKAEARARGEDIIDFGMGNPDQPTPDHIVEKLVEAARRKDTLFISV